MRATTSTLTLFALLGTLVGCNGDDTIVVVNNPPVADAGSSVTQPADQRVTLDGRASLDPDGDELLYRWSFEHLPVDSKYNLPETPSPFTPNHSVDAGTTEFQPDVVGTFVVKLIVRDSGNLYSEPSYVVVTASEPDNVPVANAGLDITVDFDTSPSVTLDGSQSFDPMGGTLAYSWALSAVPYNSALATDGLTGADTWNAGFTADVLGYYTATLVVDNGQATSTPDSVTIAVTGEDAAPVAEMTEALDAEDCTWVSLDCSGSTDPEGQQLSYYWELQAMPEGSKAGNSSFTGRSNPTTEFWPDEAGEYRISCAVFDGTSWSLPAFVTVTATERALNSAPVANAGADRVESMGDAECEEDGYQYDCEECPGATVDLAPDGEASDADSDPIEIVWTIVEGNAKVTQSDAVPTQVNLPETAPEEPGACTSDEFIFELSVTDCPHETSTDEVTITAECCGIEATGG